jgi:hypothetical protein
MDKNGIQHMKKGLKRQTLADSA